MEVPFLDLKIQTQQLRDDVLATTDRVLKSGWFVLGKEGQDFEAAFAEFCGTQHCLGVASGTEAIQIALMACGIGAGDEVVTACNTAVPTVAAITATGATPRLVDIDPQTYTMSVGRLEALLSRGAPKVKAILPVHLYGHAADMDPIVELARKYCLKVVEDCAQAHGAQYKDKPVGGLGDAGAFSFYPTKNLGAFGDGGAISTDSSEIADKVRMLRNYGESSKYHNAVHGINSRLDELQAAFLNLKLGYLPAWLAARRSHADTYAEELSATPLILPAEGEHAHHSYHLYVVRTPARNALQSHLASCGVGTAIHYPMPIHLQKAYKHLGCADGDFAETEDSCREILSIPIYPELSPEAHNHVCNSINSFKF